MDTPWITKIGAIHRPDGVGIQISNTPLLPRRVHREELRRGTTIPHAIVRGSVSGAVSEQVQADQEGRYAIRHLVFYGSTETTIEATPLGRDPIEVDATHWRVPYGILPPGEVEYSAYISSSPSVELGWGLNAKLPLQASVSQSLQNTTLRLYTLPFPTVNLNSQLNLRDRSIRGDAYWWEPWGNMNASVQLSQKPESSQLYSMNASLASNIGNIHLGVTHQQTQDKPAQTTVRSTLGFQVAQPLRLDAGIQVHTGRSKPLSVRPRVTYTLPTGRDPWLVPTQYGLGMVQYPNGMAGGGLFPCPIPPGDRHDRERHPFWGALRGAHPGGDPTIPGHQPEWGERR